MTARAAVVIGGGPAGASAALELARLGIDTVLLEQTDGSGNPVGECLAPSINPLLHRLGSGRRLAGIRRIAEPRQPVVVGRRWRSWGAHFLHEPFGHGWHLDRPAFNATLLDAVEAAGVSVWRQTRGRLARTRRRNLENRHHIAGRSANTACRHPRRRLGSARAGGAPRKGSPPRLRCAGCGPRCPGPQGLSSEFHDATTLIAAAEDGWWYTALLPNRRLAVAWFTDPDLLAASAAWRPSAWWDRLREQNLIWNLISSYGYKRPDEVRVRAAGSSLLTRPTGDGWIAVGDAAAAFDPLSSHGIGSALAGGIWAARAVAATLAGDETAFAAYSERVFASYACYLWERHAYYADEQRWPDSPFWRRRQAASSAPAEQVTGPLTRPLAGSSHQI